MIQYPIQFKVEGQTSSGINTTWTANSAENRESIQAIPPEFGGPGGGFSPEDLYALALLNCYIATFKVFAQNSNIQYETLEARGLLTVDKGDDAHPWMKHFLLEIKFNGANKERIMRLAEKTSKACLVHNSVKTKVEYKFEFN